MELKLVDTNDPILKRECKDVKEVDDKVKKFMDDLSDFGINRNNPKLLAISAPQVGVDLKVIVVFHDDKCFKLANPVIVESSGVERFFEACGTVTSRKGKVGGFVDRPYYIKVEGLNSDNENITIEADGIFAVKLQHEIDHLNGIQFIDECRLVDGKKYYFDTIADRNNFRKEHPLQILEEPDKRLDNYLVY